MLPSLAVLVLTTTIPIIYLCWTSLQNINPSMAFMNGFAGIDNYVQMAGDDRFWNSLRLTVIYTFSTVVLQVLIGLALAVADQRTASWAMGGAPCRHPAHRARPRRRRPVLAHADPRARFRRASISDASRSASARITGSAILNWLCSPSSPSTPGSGRLSRFSCCWPPSPRSPPTSSRPPASTAPARSALLAHHPADDPPRPGHHRHPAHDGGPVGLRRHLRRDRRRPRHRHRDPQSLRLPHLVQRAATSATARRSP